jgi:hypothetical protein
MSKAWWSTKRLWHLATTWSNPVLDLVDVVSITHVLLLFTCPIWVTHSPLSGLWSLGPSLLIRPSPFPSIAHNLCTWSYLSPSAILAHPTLAQSQAKRHVAWHTQHNTSWHLQLVISIIKCKWIWTQPKNLKPLNSCVNHSSHKRPRHFSTWSLKTIFLTTSHRSPWSNLLHWANWNLDSN